MFLHNHTFPFLSMQRLLGLHYKSKFESDLWHFCMQFWFDLHWAAQNFGLSNWPYTKNYWTLGAHPRLWIMPFDTSLWHLIVPPSLFKKPPKSKCSCTIKLLLKIKIETWSAEVSLDSLTGQNRNSHTQNRLHAAWRLKPLLDNGSVEETEIRLPPLQSGECFEDRYEVSLEPSPDSLWPFSNFSSISLWSLHCSVKDRIRPV